MNDLITIIIPIYNSEKYLNRCLDSIKNQSYQNLEILLLNDGSHDNSDRICRSYASDTRFKVIAKKNTGVADTRNYGLEIATGDYVMFVDSDDYIKNPHYIEDLWQVMQANHVSMIVAGMSHIKNQKTIKKEYYSKATTLLSFKDIEEKLITTNYFNACYRSLISREKLENIRFKTHLRYAEDLLFMYETIQKLDEFVYYPNCDYCYLQDSDSAINNHNIDKQIQYLDDTLYVLNEIAGKDVELQKIVKARMQEKYNYALKRLCFCKTYQEFQENYQKLSEKYSFEKYDFSHSCESITNKLRLHLLNQKHIRFYYYFNKLISWIR